MFLADGFEETEAVCPLDLLRRAGVRVKTVAVGTPDNKVTGAHGIILTADITEAELSYDKNELEMVILPGGKLGAENLDKSDAVSSYLALADDKGAYIAAICAAPYIPGKRGYLRGRRAVCYPGFEELLSGAVISDNPPQVEVDGNLITGQAMGASLQFGLALTAILCKEEMADKLAAAVIKR